MGFVCVRCVPILNTKHINLWLYHMEFIRYDTHVSRFTSIQHSHTLCSQNINKEAYNNSNSIDDDSGYKLCARKEWEAKEHCNSNNMEYVYSHCQCVKQTRQSSTVEFLSTTNGMGESTESRFHSTFCSCCVALPTAFVWEILLYERTAMLDNQQYCMALCMQSFSAVHLDIFLPSLPFFALTHFATKISMMMYVETCENKFDSWIYYNENNAYLSQPLENIWQKWMDGWTTDVNVNKS